MSQDWYRRLLTWALLLGLGGGVIALVYSGVTNLGIHWLYGDPSIEAWSGKWWWIPLLSAGAVLVVFLRGTWKVPKKVPGAIALARRGWVEPSSAVSLVVISAISLFVGASLGPSFGIIVSGGALGAWLASRSNKTMAPASSEPQTTGPEPESATPDFEKNSEYTLTGMAGGLGAIFSAPLFATTMASELSPTSKRNYVTAFIPQFIAATIGYIVFFGVTGKVMLGAFEVQGYEYENVHLLYGVLLGILSVFTLFVFAAIQNAGRYLFGRIPNPYVRAIVCSALAGVIFFAVPLTATGGSIQLSWETANLGSLSVGLLIIVLLGKMLAIMLSQMAGFLGGTVFPILFLGGTAGILVHSAFESIPISLAVAAMVAGLPGAVIGAPLSFILIAVFGVGVGVAAVAPVGIAVICAHLTVSALKFFKQTRETA